MLVSKNGGGVHRRRSCTSSRDRRSEALKLIIFSRKVRRSSRLSRSNSVSPEAKIKEEALDQRGHRRVAMPRRSSGRVR